MKLIFALVLALGCTQPACAQSAHADNFTARAAAGRQAAATPAGDEFLNSIMPMLQQVSTVCDPPGTKLPPSELGSLSLVGDITRTGTLTNIETQPQTPLAACFATNLQTHRFDPPPVAGNFPLYITLTVTN